MAENVNQVRDTLKKIQKNLECPICLELLSDPYTTQCCHPFCRTCIYTVIMTNKRARCPLCKEPITKRSMNENTRLGEIVEAVKELEQAFTEDSGIPKTPPRPISAHSHEATGTPGIIIHSLLHPTPVKTHSRAKRTEDGSHSSQSTSSQTASQSNLESDGSQATTSSSTVAKEPSSTCTMADKGESSHGKLSIKRRRKKKVKFSMEKPTIPESAKQVLSSSPLEVENTPLSQGIILTEEDGRIGNGNENKEVTEKGSLSTDQGSPSDYGKEHNISDGEASPVRKRAKIDMKVSPSNLKKTDTSFNLRFPQHLDHDISRILETPAPPAQVIEPMEYSNSLDETSSCVSKTRRDIDSDICDRSGEKLHRNEPLVFKPVQNRSPQSTKASGKLNQQVSSSSSCLTETPFIQVSELSNSSVTKVMETPFISNIQAMVSDDEEEQDESILAKETQLANLVLVPCTSLPVKNPHIQMEIEERNDLSESILAKESQDIEDHHQSPDNIRARLSMDVDSNCSVLGPTQMVNVPETQFNGSATPKPMASLHPPQSLETPPNNVAKGEFETLSERTATSSGGSTQSYHGSPVQQSGATVCIGETQFTKSQDKKCSPGESMATAMPSPPISPSGTEIQSPIIPLQNSSGHLRKDAATGVKLESSGSMSKINDTQLSASSGQNIVPSSQPSPSLSKRRSKSLLLPGLTMQYHWQPQTVQVRETDETPHLDEDYNKEEETELDGCEALSPILVSQHSERNFPLRSSGSGLIVQSPLDGNKNENVINSPSTTVHVEQSQNEEVAGPVTRTGLCVNATSISLAFYNLQSQRDNLQSQISCSMDLSSQQLELLRLEMEAKQREIDELEAALEQVEEEKVYADMPSNTQSSAKSITAVADTLTFNSSFIAASEQQERSPEHSVKSGLECIDETPHLAVVETSSNSQAQRDECVKMAEPNVVDTMPTICDATPSGQVLTSPRSLIEPAPELTSKDSPHNTQSTKSPTVDDSSMQFNTETDIGADTEAFSTSQSVEAVLQAADEVLRKLKNPPLAILEERSSLEIDEDLRSAGTPSRTSIKAKLQITKSSVISRAPADRDAGIDKALPKQERDNTDKTTLEIDSELCARTSSATKRDTSAKYSTAGPKRGQGSSVKKRKKKKASLVLQDPEATPPRSIPSESSHQNQSVSKSLPRRSTVTESVGQTSSSHILPAASGRQTTVRTHCSRDTSHGATTPQYGAVVAQTPKIQCRPQNALPIVSPCRPLATIGKNHPPSYIGSGLSKHQLRDIQTLARRNGGRLASCFNGSTSHVIVNTDENGLCSRTVKYLQGVATGRWIISHQWATDSLEAGRLLPEADYEVLGDHVTSADTSAPMKSRQMHQNESPGLFADYTFLFVGVFNNISQDHLAQLIQLSGGSLVSGIDDPGVSSDGSSNHTFVVCEEKKTQLPKRSDLVQVNSEWILDCLSNYCVIPPPSPL